MGIGDWRLGPIPISIAILLFLIIELLGGPKIFDKLQNIILFNGSSMGFFQIAESLKTYL